MINALNQGVYHFKYIIKKAFTFLISRIVCAGTMSPDC